jgi:hypothetical protein
MAMRRRKEKEATPVVLRKQGEVIRDVMLSAGQCATWLTLEELSKLTHYPPACISAQLRHMRKPRYGGFAVVKRCRPVNKAMRAEGFGALWEYTVKQQPQAPARRPRKLRSGRARRARLEVVAAKH